MSAKSTVTVTRVWVRISDGVRCTQFIGKFASRRDAESELNVALYLPWTDEGEKDVQYVITND